MTETHTVACPQQLRAQRPLRLRWPPLYFVLVTLIVGIRFSDIQALDPTQAIHTFF